MPTEHKKQKKVFIQEKQEVIKVIQDATKNRSVRFYRTALKIVQKLYTHKAVRLLTKKQKIKKALKSVRFLNNAIKK